MTFYLVNSSVGAEVYLRDPRAYCLSFGRCKRGFQEEMTFLHRRSPALLLLAFPVTFLILTCSSFTASGVELYLRTLAAHYPLWGGNDLKDDLKNDLKRDLKTDLKNDLKHDLVRELKRDLNLFPACLREQDG